ncbi:CTP synthase-like protein [Dothidotthia symphoricarpi CBS 119687]|uniref:CTP synthase n=1 Tax=Dothidotthia symphoricarpi CBS 119687 TaxID=1392245 RepID=A0A6A6A2Q2_9PLEO|nr:CTP synthase-like protein [Dothidotthia symphoricarpi CBS 119687]KAF2126282.1 CTP synthase-like protein [Dothidotthia symphoricarpi CBS 119687]
MKYVLVSGGVISGVGKGIIASSTGLLLKTIGLKVSSIKVDPYLNVDAGTMNPKEHGEVFVLSDGGEVDLDLGNYERYLNITLTRDNNITTGKIYQHVIERERKGDYLGKTVQVVPHITDAIQSWIERVARVPVDDTNEEPDVCIIELGGTVGDMESAPFIEAMSQLRRRAGKDNFMQIHVSYVPVIHGEQKTKPTQRAIKDVRMAGMIPDLIACRCEGELDASAIEKIAHFCQVETEQVVVVKDMPSIYQVPMLLEQQKLIPMVRQFLALDQITVAPAMTDKGRHTWAQWQSLTGHDTRFHDSVTIALVGKYVELQDSYLSVIKSLEHATMRCRKKLDIRWVDSDHLEPKCQVSNPAKYHDAWHKVVQAAGILVPGGFGQRATEGMIAAAKWARENKKPYLGICLGMQIAVIEYARNVCGISDATSEEFDGQAANKLIMFMPEVDKTTMGASMRLGLRPTLFQPGSEWSRLRALYAGKDTILERHRHRYEVNPDYIATLEKGGLSFVGKDEAGVRMEVIEIKDHPWFVAVQFHPEYLSRVLDPSRPYLGFVAASAGMLEEITRDYQHGSARSVEGITNGVDGIKGSSMF